MLKIFRVILGMVLMISSGTIYAEIDQRVMKDSLSEVPLTVVADSTPLITAPATIKRRVYKLKPSVDIPIVAVGTGWSLYLFTKIYNKSKPTDQQILSLNSANVNSFDRGCIYPYSKSLDVNSYYPFYGAIPIPIVLFLSGHDTRHDFWKLTFLYWEAMSITGFLGTSAAHFVDRYRPYAYNSATPLEDRKSHQVKNSFYSGHVGMVATSVFFAAKVYADYYPHSKYKWLAYGGASAFTLGMGYVRLKGGMHFPSDILLGTVMGGLTGILVPQLHKSKNPALTILPYGSMDTGGISLIYNFRTKHTVRMCE